MPQPGRRILPPVPSNKLRNDFQPLGVVSASAQARQSERPQREHEGRCSKRERSAKAGSLEVADCTAARAEKRSARRSIKRFAQTWAGLAAGSGPKVPEAGNPSSSSAPQVLFEVPENLRWLWPIGLLAVFGYIAFVVALVLRLLRAKGLVRPHKNQDFDCWWRVACPANTTCSFSTARGRAYCFRLGEEQSTMQIDSKALELILAETVGAAGVLALVGYILWRLAPHCVAMYTRQAENRYHSRKARRHGRGRAKERECSREFDPRLVAQSFGTGELREEKAGLAADDDVRTQALRILAAHPQVHQRSKPKVPKLEQRASDAKAKRSKKKSKTLTATAGVGKQRFGQHRSLSCEIDDKEPSDSDDFQDLFAPVSQGNGAQAPAPVTCGHPSGNRRAKPHEADAASRWTDGAGSTSEDGQPDTLRRLARASRPGARHSDSGTGTDGGAEGGLDIEDADGVPDFMGFARRVAALSSRRRRGSAAVEDAMLSGGMSDASEDSLSHLEVAALDDLFHWPLTDAALRC